jgi:Tfp pilus assembly protein PilX
MSAWPVFRRQTGVALLAGLVLMAAISLLALVASNSMLMQRGMAANFSDMQRARQAAEIAVAQGERYLLSIPPAGRSSNCLLDCYISTEGDAIYQASELPLHPEFEDLAWWQTQAIEVNDLSRYLVEEIHYDDTANDYAGAEAPLLDGVGYYRVLGRGTGRNKNSVVINESIVARPWLGGSQDESATSLSGKFCAEFKAWFDCGQLSWRQRR